MATSPAITPCAWIKHDGKGCPVPLGTCVDIRHFNGDTTRNYIAGGGVTFAPDGSIVAPNTARWNGWEFSDGGPMGPKFKEYRIAKRELTMEMFRNMLDAPLREVV